ncbi:S-adenosyl-L-methionine-dependent methyltransferase [Nemania sp. FL0031]|nr:S-adenosyl-L-methionine-dependent methyltransferase [Nemania sp. FL0031]
MLIKKGTLVEVTQRSEEKHSWQFLQVGNIYIDARSGQVTIRGIRLTRHRYLRGLLPRLKNELCALYDIDKSDDRPEHIQAAEEILVTEVLRTRAFSRTNDAFPRHRFNRRQWESIEDIESKGILVQRWKYCRYWPSSAAMATKRSYSGAVVRLTYADIEDEYFRVADDKLRNEFRGGIIRGGSFINGRVCTPTIDLDQGVARASPSYQKYTADDIFCGAGGATCGFRRAGLQVRLACDMDHTATSSYRANFPEALLKVKNIFDLIEELRNSTDRSDIVHISPPCQVFSPVHTRPGKNDDANVAALFACGEILKTRRPRISTGEQTFGLLHPHNEEFFNALVGQYTTLGFSFSWDILRFKEYGVPSIRRRLIWIASCPGELLPSFPHPTHVEGSINLPAPVTLRDVLRSVQPGHNDPLHNVESMIDRARSSIKFPREPYDDRIQIGTVTTAGSEVAHPSGRRNFTARELALIQGFPKRHKFVGSITQINRQIGNAFPPVVVEALYGHIRKWLLRQDRVVPRNIGTLETSSVVTREHRCRQNVVILDPIEETTVVSQLSRRQIPIIIDDDQDDEYRVQEVRVSSSGQDTGYQVHDSEDADMIDIDQARRNISRESSRTLSVESLPSLIEIE